MHEASVQHDESAAHPLDRVVWNALSSKQKDLALGDGRAVRYPSTIAPFGAIADFSSDAFDALRSLNAAQGPTALVTVQAVPFPDSFEVTRSGSLVQMVWQGEPSKLQTLDHATLGADDVDAMLALTTATQPGPFAPRTYELGRYIGVRSEGKLAAMAGERMRLDGFTEISAVCVDPAFRGRGYAGGLMKTLIASITARGETPFLHVFNSNEGAIALYRTLGFVERRELRLTVLGNKADT
jgi:ribosomal protein S18 acetylase RimI-like enzyme